jgi:pimeloyl-ACP methyl ester carboxylesterase
MATIDKRGSGDRSYVFIHGTPSDRRIFHPVADLAPDDVTLVLVDLPDHGEAPDDLTASLQPLEQATLEAVAAAPGQVTVVGHSLGAWLAAATSDRMLAPVKRFVAISGMSSFTNEDVAMRQQLLEGLESGALRPGHVREAVLEMFFGDERSPEQDASMSPMLELSREHWVRIARRTLALGERAPVHLDRPATVIHGRRDGAIPFARGEELAQRSHAEIVAIDTASHALPLTHPRVLADLIF